MLGRDELQRLLDDARSVPPGQERVELLESIVRRAEVSAPPELAVLARLRLATELAADGRWSAVFRLFDECLAAHDAQPWRFPRSDEEDLLQWYLWVIDTMIDFPDVPLARIEAALDDAERRLRAGGRPVGPLYAVRRRLAQVIGDLAAEAAAYDQWLAAGGPRPGNVEDLEGQMQHLLLNGGPDGFAAAVDLADRILTGYLELDGPSVPVVCHLMLPLARAGQDEAAAHLHRWVRIGMAQGSNRPEHIATRMEFCALTGNADAAFDLLTVLDGFDTIERPAGRLALATAVAVLAAAYIRAGRGEMLIDLGDRDGTPMWMLHDRMRDIALDLAARFDARNGSTGCGAAIRARLAATPVTEFLPLVPGSVPPCDVRPPAGLADAELLDRARWHDQRCEPDHARACLAAVGDAAGPLAAHLVELRAMFYQGPDTVDALRWAADLHRQHGNQTRALLTECWLGLCDPGEDGLAVTERAAAALRAGADDRAAGWGEHWLAYALYRHGRLDEAFAALRRGTQRAAVDPLITGTLLCLEATWRNTGRDQDALVMDLASKAVDRFVAAGAGRKAIEAVDQLATAHAWAGTTSRFIAYVERLLTRLPADAPAVFRGHLRYLRAQSVIAAGRAAEAVDDLYDALGQACAHRLDTTGPLYHLVIACHAAGRYHEALDAGIQVVEHLEHLRHAGELPDPEWADACRLLVADCYHRIGEPWAALHEYGKLLRHLAERDATGTAYYASASAAIEALRRELPHDPG